MIRTATPAFHWPAFGSAAATDADSEKPTLTNSNAVGIRMMTSENVLSVFRPSRARSAAE